MSDESKSLASAPAASSLSAAARGRISPSHHRARGMAVHRGRCRRGGGRALGVRRLVGRAAVAPRRLHGAVLPRSAAARSAASRARCSSPADGRIVAVETRHDPYLERDAIKMSVFMNVFNVHSNRSPVDGEVRKTWYHIGKFFNAALSKSSLENERAALWIRTPGGADVTCVQIAGLDRPAHPVLRAERAAPRARRALRLHPLRLARRRLPADRQRGSWRAWATRSTPRSRSSPCCPPDAERRDS